MSRRSGSARLPGRTRMLAAVAVAAAVQAETAAAGVVGADAVDPADDGPCVAA